MVRSERSVEKSRRLDSVNQLPFGRHFGDVDALQGPCAGRAEAASPVPGAKGDVPERKSWASESVKGKTGF